MQRRRIDETAWLKSNHRFKRYWKLIKLILFALLVCLNRSTHLNWFHLRNSTKAAKLDRIRSWTFFFSVLTFAYFLYFRQGLSWYRIGIGKFPSKIFFSLSYSFRMSHSWIWPKKFHRELKRRCVIVYLLAFVSLIFSQSHCPLLFFPGLVHLEICSLDLDLEWRTYVRHLK